MPGGSPTFAPLHSILPSVSLPRPRSGPLLFLCPGARPVPSGGTARRCRRVASPARSADIPQCFAATRWPEPARLLPAPLYRGRPVALCLPAGEHRRDAGAHTPRTLRLGSGTTRRCSPSSLPALRNKVEPHFPHPLPAPLQSPSRREFTLHRSRPPAHPHLQRLSRPQPLRRKGREASEQRCAEPLARGSRKMGTEKVRQEALPPRLCPPPSPPLK